MRGKYTLEFRLEAVRVVKTGQSLGMTAKVLGIPKASLSNWVRSNVFGDMGVEEHGRTLASLRHWIKARPDEYLLLCSADDVEKAHATGRLAIGFDIEGVNAVADQPILVSLYYDLGVRWMLLAYNTNSRVGGGCQDEDTGLTLFGREVITETDGARGHAGLLQPHRASHRARRLRSGDPAGDLFAQQPQRRASTPPQHPG